MRASIFVDGDSLTDPIAGWGVPGQLTWPYVFQQRLVSLGHNVVCRNFAIGGQNSGDKVAFIQKIRYYGDPVMCILMIGVNDPGQSYTQAMTQANIETWLLAAKHGVMGYAIPMPDGTWANTSQGTETIPVSTNGSTVVSDQTLLPPAQASSGQGATSVATGYIGQRFVVLADGAANGGASVPSGEERCAPTVGGAGSGGLAVWERVNGQSSVNGWHRIAVGSTPPTACKFNVVVSTQYMNHPTGGDTLATPYSVYAPVRQAQRDAVTAQNAPMTINEVANTPTVVYADLYNLTRDGIVAGSWPGFGESGVSFDPNRTQHASGNNQHLGTWGQELVQQAVMNAIPAAWLKTPLRAGA